MALNYKKVWVGFKIVAKAISDSDSLGDVEVLSSDNKIHFHNGTTSSPLVTESHSATLTNKTLTSPVLNTGVSGTAIDTDGTLAANSDTLLASQKAVKAYVDSVASSQDDASEIAVTPAGTISSINVQAALEELDTDIQNHLSDTTDAHDASAISNAPFGNLAATDVQAALNELQGDIDTNTSGLSNHLSDSSDAHDASAISVVPTGNLAASDVQAALNELQGDADTAATHIGASLGVHGIAGSVVGTSDSQTLTNKTITGTSIQTPIRSDVKQDTKANLESYALSATNGQMVFATDTKEMFQIVDNLLVAVGGEGGSGVGGVDILFAQTFETAAIGDFTQTGLILDDISPLHGDVSAALVHDSVSNQSFKQIIPVDQKFRGQAMILELNISSTASAGNVTISIVNETSSYDIVTSEQLQLSDSASSIKTSIAFTIPESCGSMSYMITALPEAGSPVTRIDDIICQLSSASLLETSVTVPNITAWQSYTPTFQGFGTPSAVEFEWRQVGENVEIRGKFTSGTTTAVEARIGLPAGLSSAGTGLIPSIQGAGNYYRGTNTATTYYTLIEPSTTYITLSAQNAGANSLTKQTAPNIATVGDSISITASVPCAGLTATSDVAIPLTQSGIVQEADFVLKAAGNAEQVITAAVTDIPFIASSVQGSSASWSGSSLTIIEDGIYEIMTTVNWTTATARRLALYVNGVDSGQAGGYDISVGDAAFSRYFIAGQVISIRDVVGGTLSNNPLVHHITITKQGSLKQVTVNTNSKITIPTSELRFEGASSRGAVATAIVKFDTLAKIRGDAFTVTNTTNDGTFVTMTKAGKLSVQADLYFSAAGAQYSITKNQTTLTSVATPIIERLSTTYVNAASIQHNSWTGDVAVGDVIRVTASSAPTSDLSNIMSVSFQEQDIQVSVSNTLPQFSESDSSVRVDTANGYGSSGTTIRRFSNIRDNIGTDVLYSDSATAGSSFIAMSSGVYSVSYADNFTGAGVVGISKNASSLSTSINSLSATERLASTTTNTSGYSEMASWTGYLSAGDVIRPHTDGSVNSASAVTSFTMSKVGKPNVTGVDVTPFVNIPQPVSQSSYLVAGGVFSASATITGALTSSNGTGIFSYNSSTGIYTALKACNVDISFSAIANGAATVTPVIILNGTNVGISNSAASTGFAATTSYAGKINVGETFYCRTGTNASDSHRISVLATAASDSILTAPETFSTDTAALTYAGSGTYTLATLANAPVGTFITFTYAINSNSTTQTTVAPTQTTADMNANGIRIFARAYNAASTAASPARVDIQIGKGLKGKTLDLYQSTGKSIAGNIDYVLRGTTVAHGAATKDYNEVTGILSIDCGYQIDTGVSTAQFTFSNVTTATSGYLVINASKNPALTGMNLNRVAARGVSSSGQSIPSGTNTTLTFNAAKTYDTTGSLNAATGVYTAPDTGYYQVSSGVLYASSAWTAGNVIDININVNGVVAKSARTVAETATTGFSSNCSDVLFLNKNDTVSIVLFQNRGSSASLDSNSVWNTFAIAKISI